MIWNIVVAVVCLVLLAVSVWKEIVRVNKSHLALRIVAVVIAVAALACIALPLTYNTTQSTSDKDKAVLLTDGFNTDTLKKYQSLPVFTTSAKIKKEYPQATLINTLSEIKTEYPQITGLHILGYGLDEVELKQLSKIPVLFHPAPEPTGITSVSLNRNVKSGEVLKVQGHFNASAGKSYEVILKGLNVTLDSATVKGSTDIDLQTTPKTNGKVVYNLIVKSGKDTIENENLPVQVIPVKPIKVLILASSPDFENRFLKNWLTANNYAVHVRTAISKDKFSTEAINATAMPLNNISATTLQNFDVVLGDQLALQSLSAAETSALRQQVTQKGLGLIIRADSSGKNNSWFQYNFPVYRTSGQTQTATALILSGKTAPTEKLNTDPVSITYKENTQILVSDAKNKALVSSTLAGSGKLVFSTINNTYNWMLAGDAADYTAYWSLLINKASRKSVAQNALNILSDIPQVNHETDVQVMSGSAPDAVSLSGLKLAFSQGSSVPFLWSAKFWPTQSGWQTVGTKGSEAADFYVFAKKDWQTIKNKRKIFVTSRYAKENLLNYTHKGQIDEQISRQIPKIWFYLLLLGACTFLWAEAKFGIQ